MEKDKMELLKDKLYDIARKETPEQIEEMNEIFAKEVEIPQSGIFNTENGLDYFDINDYM